jgi:hypothetical protein
MAAWVGCFVFVVVERSIQQTNQSIAMLLLSPLLVKLLLRAGKAEIVFALAEFDSQSKSLMPFDGMGLSWLSAGPKTIKSNQSSKHKPQTTNDWKTIGKMHCKLTVHTSREAEGVAFIAAAMSATVDRRGGCVGCKQTKRKWFIHQFGSTQKVMVENLSVHTEHLHRARWRAWQSHSPVFVARCCYSASHLLHSWQESDWQLLAHCLSQQAWRMEHLPLMMRKQPQQQQQH